MQYISTPSWKMYRAYYKVNTPLLHLFPTPQSHFKVHCTHKFTFTSLQFWKKKNSFPFVISNFPVAFFIFSLLFLALPPEWKLKVGKLIDFLRFPSVQKKEKGLYGMIHILSFIDNHKSSPKENLCICSSAVAPAAIFFAPGVVSAVETKFNWICNAVNFFHVRRVRGPFFLLFLFCFKEKGEKFCSPSRSSVFCMCCLRWNAFICREISDKSGCWKMTFYICVHLLFRYL